MSNPIIISSDILESKLFDFGVDLSFCKYGIAAEQYVLPARSWIYGQFSQDWTSLRQQVYRGFEKGSQVCQHYAQGCAWYAGIQHRNTPGHPENTALLFAEIWFKKGGVGGHAVNLAIVWEDTYQVIFFEPQTSQIVELSQLEINSCEFLRV